MHGSTAQHPSPTLVASGASHRLPTDRASLTVAIEQKRTALAALSRELAELLTARAMLDGKAIPDYVVVGYVRTWRYAGVDGAGARVAREITLPRSAQPAPYHYALDAGLTLDLEGELDPATGLVTPPLAPRATLLPAA